jgi:hypothetical protein
VAPGGPLRHRVLIKGVPRRANALSERIATSHRPLEDGEPEKGEMPEPAVHEVVRGHPRDGGMVAMDLRQPQVLHLVVEVHGWDPRAEHLASAARGRRVRDDTVDAPTT